MDDTNGLAGQFESLFELQAYCNSQRQTISRLMGENEQLTKEVEHLKGLLMVATPRIAPALPELVVSPEIAIAEMELKRLERSARGRELTLEETKRFDLLVKNLMLAREKSPKDIDVDFSRLPAGITEADLADIASVPDTEDV